MGNFIQRRIYNKNWFCSHTIIQQLHIFYAPLRMMYPVGFVTVTQDATQNLVATVVLSLHFSTEVFFLCWRFFFFLFSGFIYIFIKLETNLIRNFLWYIDRSWVRFCFCHCTFSRFVNIDFVQLLNLLLKCSRVIIYHFGSELTALTIFKVLKCVLSVFFLKYWPWNVLSSE